MPSKRADKSPISEDNLRELYALIEAPVTAFNCGTLCSPTNDGVPFCCDRDQLFPVLWKTELAMHRKWSDFWEERPPEDALERRMLKSMRPCFTVGECAGPEHCEREKRSISCRTFPFEPYLDHTGELVGLVFDHRFGMRCPLAGEERFDDVTPKFIDQALRFFTRLFEIDPKEVEAYLGTSEQKRRSFAQKGRPVPVLTRKGVKQYPTSAR